MKCRTKLKLFAGCNNDDGDDPQVLGCMLKQPTKNCLNSKSQDSQEHSHLFCRHPSTRHQTSSPSTSSFVSSFLAQMLFIIFACFSFASCQLSSSSSSSYPTSLEWHRPSPSSFVTSTPTLIESFSSFSSVSPKSSPTVHIFDHHSNANHQDETETTEGKERATETTNRNSPLDPISRPSVAPSRGPKLLPNQSRRQSKLDEPFPVGGGPQAPTGQPMPPMEARNDQSGLLNQAKAKAPGNQPSSMDDILGGLITLMGGNMKPPLGSAQSNGNADKFANFFSNLGVKPRQQHNGAQMGPPRGPPIPPFGSLPNMNHAHMQNRPPIGVGGSQFQMPPGNQFQMYPNFAFMPLMSGGSGGRPVIPLNGAGGGMPPKLPPNLPPLNGMTKAEMDALYAQFMANNGGSSGPDKAALLATLMKLAANKPFPPGLQLPPGLLAPSKPPVIHSSKGNSESSHSSGTQPTPSMDKMHPMTEPPTGGRSKVSSTLTEEPQIITMAEEPSTFEMVVKHKIGPSINSANSATVLPMAPSSMSDSPQHIRSSKPLESSKATVHFQTNPQDVVVQEIRNQHGQHIQPLSAKEQPSNSMLPKNDIVYGKRIVKPTGNPQQQSSTSTSVASTIMPSFSSSHVAPSRTANEFSPSLSKAPIRPTSTAIGRPMVMPVEVDDGVKPKVGNGRGRDPHPTASVEPTRTIDGTRGVANSKSAYPAGKPSGSFTQSASPSNSPKSGGSNSNSKANREPSASSSAKPYVRRPQFRPRPNVPIVRIDTCIVGDDSTCDISLNEKCLTELGLSSCQCRPGFARIQPRTLCIPVLSLSISFRADKMNGNKVQFTRQLLNANTEEYQYLEYESIIALNSMFAATKNLGSELMGVKVNRFSMTGGKTIVNATVHLRAESNDTSVPSIVHPSTIKRTLQQELMSVIASTNNQLGDSNLWVDSTSNAITRIDDLNECSNVDTNDCSKHARCFNEFGSFRCECELGYEDKYADDKHKSGRSCSSCSPAFCGNRGECLITNGDKTCKCRANFFGPQCEYDIELLSVAIGGSIAALIIIAITITCLYLWNQRFQQEQKSVEAMSAASGPTFSYVNKHGPPTMGRMSIDERYGRSWATHYSDSQTHLLSTGSGNSSGTSNFYGMVSDHHQVAGQPVYATPVRVIGQSGGHGAGNLSANGHGDYEQQHTVPYPDYGGTSRSGMRSLKMKSQNSTGTNRQANLSAAHHGLHYPSYAMKLAPPDAYNETEFSTRELIYSPAHLYATNSRKNHPGFYS